MNSLRITFTKGEELRYISHLDLMRAWERLLRRARVPLAYTHGFNPHPRMSFAAPLPVGVTGSAELMDVVLEPVLRDEASPTEFRGAIERQAAPGLRVIAVQEVDLGSPALPSQVRAADYRALLRTDESRQACAARIDAFLKAPAALRERRREGKTHRYDLRPLVDDVRVERWDAEQVLWMRLKVEPSATGRPDELLAALGLADCVETIERTALVLASQAG